MENYVSPGIQIPESFQRELQRLGPLFDRCAAIYNVAIKASEDLEQNRNGTGFADSAEMATYAIMARSIKTWSAVHGLCHLGLRRQPEVDQLCSDIVDHTKSSPCHVARRWA